MKKLFVGVLVILALASCGNSNKITSGKEAFKSKDGKVVVYQEEVDYIMSQEDPELLKQIPADQLEARKKQIIRNLALQKALAQTKEAQALKNAKDFKYQMSIAEDTTLAGLYIKDKTKDIAITDEEAKKVYEENKAAFTQQDDVADLQIITMEYGTPEAQAAADKALAEAKQNKDKFGEYAKKYSIDKNAAATGGATGAIPLGNLSPEFAPVREAVVKGAVGEVYPELVVVGDKAMIIKVNQKKLKGEITKFEDVKPAIIFQLKQKKVGEKTNEIVNEIEKQYDLESITK